MRIPEKTGPIRTRANKASSHTVGMAAIEDVPPSRCAPPQRGLRSDQVGYTWSSLSSLFAAPPKKRSAAITTGHPQTEEVHHLERRLALEALAEEPCRGRRSSVWVRSSGYVLLCTIAAVVFYSATLL